MKDYLLVIIGSGIGGGLRFFLSSLSFSFFTTSQLFLVAFINVLGCAFIGIMSGILVSPSWQLFISVGVLGGFTTFSGFCLGFFSLIKESPLMGIFYLFFSLIGGFLAFLLFRILTLCFRP